MVWGVDSMAERIFRIKSREFSSNERIRSGALGSFTISVKWN
jgi:hypothetical protein